MREERAAAHSGIIGDSKDNSLREVRRASFSTIVPEFSFTFTTAAKGKHEKGRNINNNNNNNEHTKFG